MSQTQGAVLVVEDQPGLLKLYEVMLEQSGFTVHTAEGGPEALAIFEQCQQELDIVIMDYHLPNMTGLDVYRKMLMTRPGLKAVLCSGAPEATLIDQIDPVWPVRLLSKPFATKKLLAVVSDMLMRND